MPTNQEWLHKLANESPDELKAWFDAEYNDNLAVEKVVNCDAAHSNDANAHLKASEDLSDGFTDSRENLGSEPSTSEVFGGKGSEVDSREKLEADIWYFIENNGWFGYEYEAESYADCRKAIFEIFKEWLDRQAAISERELCAKCEWPSLAAMPDLEQQKRIAEQDRRIVEYAEQVDRLQRRNDELRTSYDKLKRERDNLADDLLACNREREQLRKHLGIALDHAHDICASVDIGD